MSAEFLSALSKNGIIIISVEAAAIAILLGVLIALGVCLHLKAGRRIRPANRVEIENEADTETESKAVFAQDTEIGQENDGVADALRQPVDGEDVKQDD